MNSSITFEPLMLDNPLLSHQSESFPKLRVFRDLKTWTDFWQNSPQRDLNFLPLPAPEVDFTRSMVIEIRTASQATGGYRVEVDRIENVPGQGGDRWLIHCVEHAPDNNSFASQQPTTPGVFILTERSDAVLELNLEVVRSGI